MYGRNIMKFDSTTLRFHRGTNTTIRRFGSGFYPGNCKIYSVDTKGDHRFIYYGEITNMHTFQFDNIPDQLLAIHHLGNFAEPTMGYPKRLNKVMQKYYKDFHPYEIVQVISFKIFFDGIDDLPF